MSILKRKADYIFITLLGLFIAYSLYQHFSYDYELSINNYVAFGLWVLAIVLMFTKFNVKEYSLLVILGLATFNIINFSAMVFRATIGYRGDTTIYELPSVNLIMLLMTVVYCLLNRKFVRTIFRPSEEEERIKLERDIQFYLNKFKDADEAEWQRILSYENDYPLGAQIAIRRLKTEGK